MILTDKPCSVCGAKVQWQTKDLVIDDIYPVANYCDSFQLNERMDAEIYTTCDKCGTSLELKIVKGKIV